MSSWAFREIDTVSGSRNICAVVSVSNKGAVSFVDVENNVHPIPEVLKKCLTDLIGGADFSSVPDVSGVQPFRFQR